MSNAKKKHLAAFALCFLAWQALFIWLCTLGESVTIMPWFFKYVPLTEARWEWLLAAPGYGVLSSSAMGWTRLAVLVMRIAFIIIIANSGGRHQALEGRSARGAGVLCGADSRVRSRIRPVYGQYGAQL